MSSDNRPQVPSETADFFRAIGFVLGCFAVAGGITLACVLAARWLWERL